MPEFEQRKRKTMSQQELYDEYRSEGNTSRKNTAVQKSNPKKKSVKKKTGRRKENQSVSEERKRKQQELSQKQTAAKKSKTYAGKTSGKSPKSGSGSYNSSHKSSKPSSRSSLNSSRTLAEKRDGPSSAGRTRKKQKKRSGRYTLYYVLIGILAVAVLTVLSTTVLFNIGVFVVSGETAYSDEEIIEASGIAKGENLIRINVSKAEENIVSKLVYIESARIHRGFPNRLTISVEPAKPAAAFAYGGKYYIISENKRLLEISDAPLNCPIVKGVQIVLQPKEEEVTATADNSVTADISAPAVNEGITLENNSDNEQQEIKEGVVFGDDNANRIKLALIIIKNMEENGLNKNYEINIADTLRVGINYDGHIQIDLGSTAALGDKIYHAGRIIEEDVADNENCTLNLTNPNRAVKRPVYENEGNNNTVTTEPETAENTQTEPPREEP